VAHFIGRRPVGSRVSLLLRLSVSGHHLRASDQDARVDAQGPGEQAEYHDCADPEAGPATRKAATIFYPIARG
jgi:hypothetical protein